MRLQLAQGLYSCIDDRLGCRKIRLADFQVQDRATFRVAIPDGAGDWKKECAMKIVALLILTGFWPVVVANGQEFPLPAAAEPSLTKTIDVRTISGTITDHAGQPLAGLQIGFMKPNPFGHGPYTTSPAVVVR